MDKDSLIKQINTFLDESPFEDDEIFFWKKNILEMDEKDLEELFSLLKDKLKIITDANNLFIKIAEDEIQERDKRQEIVPAKASIVDMTINDLAEIFNGGILEILKDESIDIFCELDKYFNNSKLLGEDVVKSFDILIKALYENKNIFTRTYEDLKSVTVGDWLKFYNVFNDQPNRTSIDRISFVSDHEKARKLDQERKDVLLKLLKLYDFLINPGSVEIGTRSPLSQRVGRGDFSEAGVGNIGLTVATRDRLENNSSTSESMGDTSGLYRREIPLAPFTKGGTKKDSVAKNSFVSQEAGRIPLEKDVGDIAKKAYIFSFDEQKLIKQNEEDIKRIARGNIILVGKELTRASEQKNRPRVIAALRLAVKNNLLIGWAEKNVGERIMNQESGIMNGKRIMNQESGIMNGKRIMNQESGIMNGGGGRDGKEKIKKLGDVQVLVKFLRQMLEERLGLSENEAAKIGAHLFNLFRKQGRDVGYLAYYDEENEEFRWMLEKDG